MNARFTPDDAMTIAAARSCATGRCASSASGCRRRRPTSPAAPTPEPRARLRVRARSAPSPTALPLSIGDGELADTADSVISVPEVFNYWLQPGRIDVGFLGGAQIDRFANINSTVIGDYADPKVRLPGRRRRAGDRRVVRRGDRAAAPDPRAFVERVDFVSSVGFGDGPATASAGGCAAPARRWSSPTSASCAPIR